MFNRYLFSLCLLAFISCKKNNPEPSPEEPAFNDPAMTYIDLTGKSVAMDQSLVLDIDGNKKMDLLFYTERQSLEHNTKSASVFTVISGNTCYLANNMLDDTTPILQKGDPVSHVELPGYEWYPVVNFTLMQYATVGGQSYWEGPWKDLDHRYLPFELLISGKAYLGWVELFADAKTSRLTFYRAAMSKEPQTRIRAGH
jgi:hypothetical protein